MAKPALFTLFTLCSASQLASALQVSPNSPCSSVCRDSLDLDVSDPNSSNTRNSDITCKDADFASPAGSKFRECMTCLQTSTFSQGSESDVMWFLYNLRYTAAYCVFGFPNATDFAATPCTTETACGHLQASMQHGIEDPRGTTAYSYCSAGRGEAMDSHNFETCIPCVGSGTATDYLANFFVALEAGCQQQPAPGVLLGLNDTIFSDTRIGIVDPTTLIEEEESKPGLGVPVIVGIVAGVLVFLLAVAGITFVCLRKRKNKRSRASAEADFYTRFNNRHRSSMSFQCQTHMVSPRFWPGAGPGEGVPSPVDESPEMQVHRSSIWKPHEPEYAQEDTTAHISRKAAMAAVPLHQITTEVSPVRPPQAYTSPSSAEKVYHSPSDLKCPLSAESVRSTSALLPSIKPYIPADHGVHVQSTSPTTTFTSPTSATTTSPVHTAGTGMTPLLKSHAWPLPEHTSTPTPTQTSQPQRVTQKQKHIIKLNTEDYVPPPPPPPLKTSRSSGILGKKSPKLPHGGGTGSPVESREIRTAFAAPPRR